MNQLGGCYGPSRLCHYKIDGYFSHVIAIGPDLLHHREPVTLVCLDGGCNTDPCVDTDAGAGKLAEQSAMEGTEESSVIINIDPAIVRSLMSVRGRILISKQIF